MLPKMILSMIMLMETDLKKVLLKRIERMVTTILPLKTEDPKYFHGRGQKTR